MESHANSLHHLVRGTTLLLKQKQLWPSMVYPVMGGIFTWFVIFFFGVILVWGGLIKAFIDPTWSALFIVVWGLVVLALSTLFFFTILNFVLCLFNSRLSRRILKIYGVTVPVEELELGPVIKIEFLKLGIILPLLILAGLCSLIPVIGPVLGYVITGFSFVFQYVDYSHEVLLRGARERFRFAQRHFKEFFILGLVMVPALSIPVLNFFAIPWAIAVTSSIVAEEENSVAIHSR